MIPTSIISIVTNIRDFVAATFGFGVPLLVAKCPAGIVGMQTYTLDPDGLSAMLTAGFTTKHPAYRIAARMASQSRHCGKLKVYPRAAGNTCTLDLTPTITTQGYTYQFQVDTDGTPVLISYVVPGSATIASICAALTPLFQAVPGVTCVNGTSKITLTPTTAGDRVYFTSCSPGVTFADVSADAGIAADLTNALAADPDWYGLLIDSTAKTEIAPAAAFAETNKRMFLALSNDSANFNAGSTTDILYTSKALGYNYTAILTSRNSSGNAHASLLALVFALNPGQATFAHKGLTGTVADRWTASEFGALETKKGLAYSVAGDAGNSFHGWAVSGRFLDLTYGVDWITDRIAAAVYEELRNSDIVAYTDEGIAKLEKAIRGALGQAVERKLIQNITITVPKAADVSQGDKGTRLLQNVQVGYVYAGGIHKMAVTQNVAI